MKDKEYILLRKTLIEIYERELRRQSYIHIRFLNCKKCKSLILQKARMINELKQKLKEKQNE